MPLVDPTGSGDVSLVVSEAGVGFVLLNRDGTGWTRGWIREVSEESVVVEYAIHPLADDDTVA